MSPDRPAPAAGARLPKHVRKLAAQAGQHVIQPAHVADPGLALLVGLLRPTDLGPGAIMVPFDELDRAVV